MDTKILNHSRTYQPVMEKIIGATMTFVVFVSITLIGFSSTNNSVSAASFGAFPPSMAQDMLKLKSMQQGPNDQTSEFPPTEEQFPPSEGEMTTPQQETAQPIIQKYKIAVRFNEITVHNDHEGKFSGDGEYDLKAYVHGIMVDLTKLSTWRDAGLTDVSSGETVSFSPQNQFTVNIDSTLPLLILTVGDENDGCASKTYPTNIQPIILDAAANETAKAFGANGTQKGSGSGSSTLGTAGAAAGTAIGSAYGGPAGAAVGAAVGKVVGDKLGDAVSWGTCKINSNDAIGTIEESYVPPQYGAGNHEVKSSSGDFTLKYSIAVQRVQ